MDLLRDIQQSVVESTTDLPSILRKCRIFAARLMNQEFINWVQSELDGYNPDEELPDYRVISCNSYGNFSGPYGSGLTNVPIPILSIPEEYRDYVSEVRFRQGISALNSMIEKDAGSLKFAWPPNLLPIVGSEIYERMVLLNAWFSLDKFKIISIVETVRNRILNFALEIESSIPEEWIDSSKSAPVLDEVVSNVFNTNIWGNVGNYAAGSSEVIQRASIVVLPGNWESLKKHLMSFGIDDIDIEDLRKAIEEDPKPTSSRSLGRRVSEWIGNMATKSAQGILQIPSSVAVNIITSALMQYYNLL